MPPVSSAARVSDVAVQRTVTPTGLHVRYVVRAGVRVVATVFVALADDQPDTAMYLEACYRRALAPATAHATPSAPPPGPTLALLR